MKYSFPHAVFAALFLASLPATASDTEKPGGQVIVQTVTGDVKLIDSHGNRQALTADTTISTGTAIETGANGAVDLMLQYNGTALRLTPGSRLELTKLAKEQAGDELVTETNLKLVSGAVIGSQRKLNGPSSFSIQIPGGTATIKGTEYVVRADGAVSVLSGVVRVNYNQPKGKGGSGGGAIQVSLTAGQSFNPATGQVVPTTPDYLQNVLAEIETVRNNARVFKASGATVVVQAERAMSPSKGNNGVGNGVDPQPPGNPPVNDGPGTAPGSPGNQGGPKNAKGK
jgi:hypothetical protein